MCSNKRKALIELTDISDGRTRLPEEVDLGLNTLPEFWQVLVFDKLFALSVHSKQITQRWN